MLAKGLSIFLVALSQTTSDSGGRLYFSSHCLQKQAVSGKGNGSPRGMAARDHRCWTHGLQKWFHGGVIEVTEAV